MIIKLLIEHHLECLSLERSCRGLSESTCVKMSHCWKSHALAHILLKTYVNYTCFRVFTLGIGSGVSTSLIEGLARAGNGKAEFISNNDLIQSKVYFKLI